MISKGRISILFTLKVADDMDSRLLCSGITGELFTPLPDSKGFHEPSVLELQLFSTCVYYRYVILDRQVEDLDRSATALTFKAVDLVMPE